MYKMDKAVLIYKTPTYELYVERIEKYVHMGKRKSVNDDLVCVNLYSVWPQARTDRAPHKLLNVNLPKRIMDKLGNAIKGVEVCTCNESIELHSCPFSAEVDGDSETLCACCPTCTKRCGDNI